MLFFVSLIPHVFASSDSNYTYDENENYVNQLLEFSFHPPDGWTLQELKKTQVNAPDVAVVAPKVEGFSPSISISVVNSNGTSLEDYAKDKRTQLQSANNSGKLVFLSHETSKINGYDAEISEAKDEFFSQNQNFEVKFKEVIIAANNKFYTLTYANQEKYFNNDLQNFEDTLNSFHILSNKTNSSNFFLVVTGIVIVIGITIAILFKKKNSRKSISNKTN